MTTSTPPSKMPVLISVVIFLGVLVTSFLPYGLILRKAGIPPWHIIIPFLGIHKFYRLSGRPPWMAAAVQFIGYGSLAGGWIGLIMGILAFLGHCDICMQIAKRLRFEHHSAVVTGLGIALVPIFMCPMIVKLKGDLESKDQLPSFDASVEDSEVSRWNNVG